MSPAASATTTPSQPPVAPTGRRAGLRFPVTRISPTTEIFPAAKIFSTAKISPVAKILLHGLVAALTLPLACVAVLTAGGWLALPYELAVIDDRLPWLFRIHMLFGALTLVLVPAAIVTRRRACLHRPLGRAAAVAVLVAGLTALPVALASLAIPLAIAGFLVQAIAWLGLLGIGWRAIRSGDVGRHRRAMVCLAAVTSAAIWLRPAMILARLGDWPFETAYAVIAWGTWLAPLAVAAAATARARTGRRRRAAG